MKEKTTKRLKLLIRPLFLVWVVIALTIALIGAILKALAYLMVGKWANSKEQFTDKF